MSVDVPGGAEVAIDPLGFREAFAGDIDDETAAELAIVQRPANVKAVSEAVVNEAFRAAPSWVLSPGKTGRSAITCSSSWLAAPTRISPSSTPRTQS